MCIDSVHDICNCPVCLGVVIEPKQCSECQKLTCSECVEKWLSDHNDCPAGCGRKFESQRVHPLAERDLERLTFKCKHCDDLFSYTDAESHIRKHFVAKSKCVL